MVSEISRPSERPHPEYLTQEFFLPNSLGYKWVGTLEGRERSWETITQSIRKLRLPEHWTGELKQKKLNTVQDVLKLAPEQLESLAGRKGRVVVE